MTDINLLFKNAQTFNEPGSQVSKDAIILNSIANASLNAIPTLPLLNPLHLKEKYGFVFHEF